MGMPAVSIVMPMPMPMPMRNAEDTLDECLASIARQSFADHELLIVDDGSTDASVECVQRWAQKDACIHLMRQAAKGIVSALNVGFAAARAPLIARMDADDRMRAEHLQLQVQVQYLQRHPYMGLVSCQVHLFPEGCLQAESRCSSLMLSASVANLLN